MSACSYVQALAQVPDQCCHSAVTEEYYI